MKIKHVRGTFTRPADTTAYASGDLVADSTTAGSVTPVVLRGFGLNDQDGVMIRKLRLWKSGTSTTNAVFRVHLFRSLPTVVNGDNGALSTTGVASYVEYFDVTMSSTIFTDGATGFGVPSAGFEEMERLAQGSSQTLYALVEARAAYTPLSAEVFNLSIHDVED